MGLISASLRLYKNMNIALWTIVGAFIGGIGHLLDKSPAKGGFFAAVIFGVGGALLGGSLATLLFSGALQRIDLSSLAMALSGGILLLLIHRTIFSEQRKF